MAIPNCWLQSVDLSLNEYPLHTFLISEQATFVVIFQIKNVVQYYNFAKKCITVQKILGHRSPELTHIELFTESHLSCTATN